MNYIDLFSGIGGFSLGAYYSEIKFKNHFYSEINDYCIKLFKKRFPDSISLGDIKSINCKELIKKYGKEWIVTGGFPCQDISIAGAGKGITGARSILWFEMWRIIRDLQPIFAIVENVPALTIRGINRVLGSLSEIGYNAEWQIISAEEMGAPHKRERLWIITYPASIRLERCREKRETKRSIGLCNRKRCNKIEKVFFENAGQLYGETWRKIAEKLQRQYSEWNSRNYFERPMQTRTWSKTCSGVDRMDARISTRMDRLAGLGNSIIPQIAELLFLRIKELL